MAKTLFVCTVVAAVVLGVVLCAPEGLPPPLQGVQAPLPTSVGKEYAVTGDACERFSLFVKKAGPGSCRNSPCEGVSKDQKSSMAATCPKSDVKQVKTACLGGVVFSSDLITWICSYTIYSSDSRPQVYCGSTGGPQWCYRDSASFLAPLSAISLTLVAFLVQALHWVLWVVIATHCGTNGSQATPSPHTMK